MRKRILSVALVVVMVVCLCTCGTTYQEAIGQTESNTSDDFGNGYFTKITNWSSPFNEYAIYYANDTKVKYLIYRGANQFGITPLYNTDGTLQIYEPPKETK